jgi:hypothetical protein
MPNRLEPATRHYDEKLQEILKTSAKIFAEKGFHHTSVRDISRATKMSLSGPLLLFHDQRRAAVFDPGALFRYARAALGASPGSRSRRARENPLLSLRITSVFFSITCLK